MQLPEAAAAAAAAAGLLHSPLGGSGGGAGGSGSDAEGGAESSEAGGSDDEQPQAAPLPGSVVEQLLLERYHAKYSGRLRLPQKMPLRAKWLKLQQQQAHQAGEPPEGGGAAGDIMGVS